MAIHISKLDDFIKKIINTTFPEYKGKKIKISTNIPKRLNTEWSCGSKEYYAFYELATGKQFVINNTMNLDLLPSGVILVEHSIFCGKDMGITIYANSEQLAPLLPQNQEISENERIVLYYTRNLKSSYNGIKNFRFHEAHCEKGISQQDWDNAKQSLIEKKLLNRAGAITPNGRNVLE